MAGPLLHGCEFRRYNYYVLCSLSLKQSVQVSKLHNKFAESRIPFVAKDAPNAQIDTKWIFNEQKELWTGKKRRG